MAQREFSSTLRNQPETTRKYLPQLLLIGSFLVEQFMQRAVQKEEKPKKEEEEVKPDGNFFFPGTATRKCVVIMEGDPHPGAAKGHMSFQSFNPLIDKINEEAENLCQSEAPPTTSSTAQAAFCRENGSSSGDVECVDADTRMNEANGDLKRKQTEVVREAQYPNKSPRNGQNGQSSSPSSSRNSRKQKSKQEKLDWSLLRPSKGQKRKG